MATVKRIILIPRLMLEALGLYVFVAFYAPYIANWLGL